MAISNSGEIKEVLKILWPETKGTGLADMCGIYGA